MTMNEKDIDLIPTTPGEVAKAIAYLIAALATLVATSYTDGVFTELELLQGAVALVGVVPVYFVSGRIPKLLAAVLVALLQSVIVIVAGGTGLADITPAAWASVLLAGLAVAGVALVPNAPKPGPLAVVPAMSPQQARVVQDAIDVGKAEDRGPA